MSPRIERVTNLGKPDQRRELIADVPDETGVYQTLYGDLTLDISLINPDAAVQTVVLQGQMLRGNEMRNTNLGRREVQVHPRTGAGQQMLSKTETLVVQLNDRPIRNSVYEKARRERRSLAEVRGDLAEQWRKVDSYSHPRWKNGHGHRG